jgi:cytochrome P450
LDIVEEMHRLTLQIVGQTLFNIDLSDEANIAGRAFTTVFRLITDYVFLPFPPLSVPTPRNLRLNAALRTLDRVVYGVINERRQQNEGPGDLLSMLLEARDEETGEGMNDQQVRDQIMTLLLAGHETTANTLAWTCYLLSLHPEVEQRLFAELESVLGGRHPTVEDLNKLPYTQMLIKESMRLYPASWAIPRHAVDEDKIGGYYIPAHSLIWISPYATQRHPDFWEHPEVFDPERFTSEREASRPRFAYFPFGGGPHICLGSTFSMMEVPLIIATIAQRYRLHLVPGHEVKPKVVLTLQPANGLPMTLQER